MVIVLLEPANTAGLVAMTTKVRRDDTVPVFHAAFMQHGEMQALAVGDLLHVLQQLKRVKFQLVLVFELFETSVPPVLETKQQKECDEDARHLGIQKPR